MRKKKNKASSKTVHFQSLPVINPDAAGIDVGAKEHVVAVPCDRDLQPVRTFQAFTPDLHELAAWLKRCGIQTVALESTGSTGSVFTESWSSMALKSEWSTRGTLSMCPGEPKPTYWTANGFKSCTASGC